MTTTIEGASPSPGDLSAVERVAMAERIMVPHLKFKQALSKIERNHSLSKHTAEPRCVAIVGETGAGKTTVARVYAGRHPVITAGPVDHMPVLSLKVPARPRIKSMAETMLLALGDPFANRGTTPQMTIRLIHLIRELNVELIMIDEFQHFVEVNQRNIPHDVADWLKTLIDESRVPVVLLGLPSCTQVFDANEQLARRFSERYEITSFNWKSPTEKAEFRSVLRAICRRLPFRHVLDMSDQEFAFRMHAGTGGRVGYVMNVIRTASEVAAFASSDDLDLKHVVESYEQHVWRREMCSINPFSVPLAQVERDLEKRQERGQEAAVTKREAVELNRLLARR